MTWTQVYEPHGWHWLPSALLAPLPGVLLIISLTSSPEPAPSASPVRHAAALVLAFRFIGMPWPMALALLLGAANGFSPVA
jgi:L-lactate permease